MNTKDFENRFMRLVSGQMPLPQSIFRQFLDWLQGEESSDVSSKQDATDNNLNTTNKTVVGAINEVRNTANLAKSTADNALPAENVSYEGGYLFIKIGTGQYQVSATPVD